MSNDIAYLAKSLADQVEKLTAELAEAERQMTRYQSAHVILMIERERLMNRIKELEQK